MVKAYCAKCSKKCVGDVLKVGDKYFHLNCFKCKECNVNLDTGGFYFRDGDYYCPKDYTIRFSNKCFICSNIIESEIVSALNNHFHRTCFKCSICEKIFSPGDRVTMKCDQFICNSCLSDTVAKELNEVKMREVTGRQPCVDTTNNDPLDDDIITDQGYISADPASFSVPISRYDRNQKSNSTRSLFEFGKFYRSSYLDIQKVREKEHQSQLRGSSSRISNNKLSNNKQLSVPKTGCLKTQNSDSSSTHTAVGRSINSPRLKMTVVSESDVNEKENVIRLSSYPAGEKLPDNVQAPLDRDDWPAPLSTSILINDKVFRKKNLFLSPPTVKASDVPKNVTIDYSQSLNHLVYDQSEKRQRNLIDILRGTHIRFEDRKLDANVISSSRSPNANREPLSRPRYSNHKDKSKSRDSSYFTDSQRHIGYSLEFISSTSRPFMAGMVPYESRCGYTSDVILDNGSEASRGSRTLNVNNCGPESKGGNEAWTDRSTSSGTFDLPMKSIDYNSTIEETLFDYESNSSCSDIDMVTGLKLTKRRLLFKDRIKEPSTMLDKSSSGSKVGSVETLSCRSQKTLSSSKNFIVNYQDLVTRDSTVMKGLDVTRLEMYLSIEEFQRLFKLNRADFYRLPEWKRNDLKRRVKLF